MCKVTRESIKDSDINIKELKIVCLKLQSQLKLITKIT